MTRIRSVPAYAVSSAVHARLSRQPAPARVLLRTSAAIHLDAGGFVVAIVDRRAPLAPNAIMVTDLLGELGPGEPGHPATVSAGCVRTGDLAVTWDPHRAPLWEPRVGRPARLEARDAADWAARLLGVLSPTRALTPQAAAKRLFGGADLDALEGFVELLGSVRRRDPGSARGAARLLTGRGPGLTPVGDDLIAGAAVTVAALGDQLGFPPERRRGWRRAAVLPDLADRTTAVSATLLRLAAHGLAPEPLHGVLHGAAAPDQGLRSLSRLVGIGHTTGWATAAAAGLCMAELAAAAGASSTRKEAA
jgi:Protein of unknown function (DUF2877)